MSMVSRIFCSLEGTWKLSRIIPNQGSVEGVAHFKKDPSYPDILFYREEGVFTFSDGNQYAISQEYEYRYSKEKISVYFVRDRDRLLHYLEFTEPNKASGMHLCGCDIYFATYEFKLPSEFELMYDVQGPKKNYRIQTVFEKSLQ
jgi:hypothetical protein